MRVVTPGFHKRVFAMVRRVPRGRVSTYGRIAALLGARSVARHVGWALAACKDKTVPWHRIVNATGGITHPDATQQRRLLAREGVRFRANGRIDLGRFGWPDQARRKSTLT
jgi:methylated-DNA-protein-cysteine methyltransferase related protein